MLVIGLSGKFGSGKDYIGNLIVQYFKTYHPQLVVYTFGFADPLKMHVLSAHPKLCFEDVYPPESKDKLEAVRKLLQEEGDLMRKYIPRYWIEQYTHWIKLFERRGCDVLITCDVRFRDELDYIVHERRGIVCKVHAPNRSYKPTNLTLTQHISECHLDHIPDEQYFFVFNNDADCLNLEQAEERFRTFFKRLERI